MLDFTVVRDDKTGETHLETSLSGKCILTIPQLNKGTAFSFEERCDFGLLGKLPHRIETLEEQVERAYLQYSRYETRLQQHIYLNNLHDKNQVLFYALVKVHLSEMLPTVYTPIVGHAVKQFSHEYRQPRGLYISHLDQDFLDDIFNNRSNPNIDLIVVTDGEGVLGIGDQGIGGMDIPVAKLMVYGLCGMNPTRTLPVFLDVGTNNSTLLNDPFYLGCRHPRIEKAAYDTFIARFVETVKRHFPEVFLHWEDFGRGNARRLLDHYQDEVCSFNDDIQGTGAVALAALLAACDATGIPLDKHRIIVFGAGSAGTGICDQVIDALIESGVAPEVAYRQFWLIDRQGLLISLDKTLTDAQIPYARPENISLSFEETVDLVKPTILIGCSARAGAFTKSIVESMASHCEHPIIFPLSNPDDHCEATPDDLLAWTKGRAYIATGTAFENVAYLGMPRLIAQCNNALIFPGIGLGVIAVKASRLSKKMMMAASRALSQLAPAQQTQDAALLPLLSDAPAIAKHIALAVAEQAIAEGLATHIPQNLQQSIESNYWDPSYLPFKFTP